jgi:uncharacterized protein (UPF0261 family)
LERHLLIPKKGWSEADEEGMELFDPEADQIFVEELKKVITPGIPIEEIDVHISEPVFGLRAADVLDRMIRSIETKSNAIPVITPPQKID